MSFILYFQWWGFVGVNGIVPDCSIVMLGSCWESQIFLIWAGSVYFGGNVVLFGWVGPFWPVQSYVIHCTSEFNNKTQTTDRQMKRAKLELLEVLGLVRMPGGGMCPRGAEDSSLFSFWQTNH
jgi:hypothetical protein